VPDADFSNVRVEANNIKTTTLRWEKIGAVQVDVSVYRSIDGVSYSLVAGPMSSDIFEYEDTLLDDGTKYWYKLTQDGGATFSDIVTVVTYLASNQGVSRHIPILLPRAPEVGAVVGDMGFLQNQQAATQEHTSIAALNLDEDDTPCPTCSVDGALVLDCGACNTFRVIMHEDINSITVMGCDGCPPVDFIIPPGETFGICGWPVGACFYSGDECFQAPIVGGPDGKTAKTTGESFNGYGDVELASSSCVCTSSSSLNIQCCSESCTLSCPDNQTVKLKACQGIGPYTWGIVDGIVTLTDAVGVTAIMDVGNTNAQLSALSGKNTTAFVTEAGCLSGAGYIEIGYDLVVVAGFCSSQLAGVAHEIKIRQHNTLRNCAGGLVTDYVDLFPNIKLECVSFLGPNCCEGDPNPDPPFPCNCTSTFRMNGEGCGPINYTTSCFSTKILNPHWMANNGLTSIIGFGASASSTQSVRLIDADTPDLGLSHPFTVNFSTADQTVVTGTILDIDGGCP